MVIFKNKIGMITDFELKEIKSRRMIIENNLKEIEKRKEILKSTASVRNIRRPRLERGLGRGGLLRRQKQSSFLDSQKKNLLIKKSALDKLLKEKPKPKNKIVI